MKEKLDMQMQFEDKDMVKRMHEDYKKCLNKLSQLNKLIDDNGNLANSLLDVRYEICKATHATHVAYSAYSSAYAVAHVATEHSLVVAGLMEESMPSYKHLTKFLDQCKHLQNMLRELKQENRSVFTDTSDLIKYLIDFNDEIVEVTSHDLMYSGHKGYKNYTDLELLMEVCDLHEDTEVLTNANCFTMTVPSDEVWDEHVLFWTAQAVDEEIAQIINEQVNKR